MSGEIPILKPDPRIYPEKVSERTRLILSLRPHGVRQTTFHYKPSDYFEEEEVISPGFGSKALAIILQARECPWVCVMCDLWRGTRESTLPQNSITRQIEFVYKNLGYLSGNSCEMLKKRTWYAGFSREIRNHPTRIIKLYNAGSFFDAASIPPEEYYTIAQRVVGFDRVIVECHPKLVGNRILDFLECLKKAVDETGLSEPPKLEVGMGLEVADDRVLALLNKKMNCADFERACNFLRKHGIDVRAFILANPPFITQDYFVELAMKSAKFAFDCGVNRVVFIPTRAKNGAMEFLEKNGYFSRISIGTLESILEHAVKLKRGIAVVDTWEIEGGVDEICKSCFGHRVKRLTDIGFAQKPMPRVHCKTCNSG